MTTRLLDTISNPDDLSSLSYEELDQLANELRATMVATTSITGGHLAPSLGSVEIIIALHRALDCPKDRIIFDVGHQAYAHKLLTGRKDEFSSLRQYGGLSGFPKITESEYDSHNSGHASDSLSTALGYALARDIDGGDETIAVVVGDASFTGGMSMEALNTIGHTHTRMVIILNDNGMSISPNVGGFAAYLAKARMSNKYLNVRNQVEEAFNSSGRVGRLLMKGGNVVKETVKQMVLPGDTFLEGFGLTYVGPVDGHDVETLEAIISDAKYMDGPVVVHAVTTKGKGYKPAEENPGMFHGVAPFDIATGKLKKKSKNPSWTSVFADELLLSAEKDERIVAITAAMTSGTGLDAFSERFPNRFFDVGIAEENAVTMASALAMGGKIPVVALYSTFMQRAYDQALINVGLQKQHVVFCLDRAGLVGADGPTHHGAFDLSYMRTIPGMKILAPSSDAELRAAIRTAFALDDGPVTVRYPRGTAVQGVSDDRTWEIGKARLAREGRDVALLAVGLMLDVALQAADMLSQHGIEAAVYDMRWVKPVDHEAVGKAAELGKIVTLEDNSIVGGFGSAVLESLANQRLDAKVVCLGLPDEFVEQGDCASLYESLGLDAKSICERVLQEFGQ